MGKYSKRKEYKIGDKFLVNIPNYVDEVTLNWINSRGALTSAIWDVIRKEAYKDIAVNRGIVVENKGDFNTGHVNVLPQTQNHQTYNEDSNQISKKDIKQIEVVEEKPFSSVAKKVDEIAVDNIKEASNHHLEIAEVEADFSKDVNPTRQQKEVTLETKKVIKGVESTEKSKVKDSNPAQSDLKKVKDNKSGGLDLNSAFKKKKKVGTLTSPNTDRSAFNSSKPNKLAEDILSE